jgi:hypothetical protein
MACQVPSRICSCTAFFRGLNTTKTAFKWLNDDAIRACFVKICTEAELATTGDQGAISLAFNAADWVEEEEPAFVTEGRRLAKAIIGAVGLDAQTTLPLVEDDFQYDFKWATMSMQKS